jgi:hypothetical protein
MNSYLHASARQRVLMATLFAMCVALATCTALVASLLVTGGAPLADSARGERISVSVFGDEATPSAQTAAVASAVPAALTRVDSVSLTDPAAAEGTVVDAAAVEAVAEPVGVFPDDPAPATTVDPDERSVELGLRFTPKLDGSISAIRFYKTAANLGPHIGSLWGPNGEVLARVTFPEAQAEGWQTAAISPAVDVEAGTTYTASYLASHGRYAADENFFDSGRDTEYLSVSRAGGVYAYGAGAYPTEVYRNSNYYVDVTFQPSPAEPQPTPTPESTPDPTATPEPTPSPDPTASPEPTPQPEPTASPEPTPRPTASDAGVFDGATAPTTPVDPDRNSVELGMRFVPKVDGDVTALRFYRTAANAGPHVGTLWDAAGNRLATASFTVDGEGWQTAEFTAPVALQAGSTYVVSYLARSGQYAADEGYFDVGIDTPYFTVPVGAGVYAYGAGSFPSEVYRNSNYYVDLRFSPAEVVTPTPTPTPSPTTSPTATPTPSPTATPTPTPSPTPTPTPTRPDPGTPSVLDLPTEAWWGGSAYYSRFEKATAAGWSDPSYFPIAVFFGKPSHADELAALGINTYMAAEHDGSPVSMITREGISVLANDEWTPSEVGNDPLVVGWNVSDECDMGYSGCAPEGTEAQRLADQQRLVNERAALDDGRFLQANFGNGVLGTHWAPTTMDDHVALMDVTSVDKYAYTSPHVQWLLPTSPAWPAGKNPASSGAYGWLQDRMETFSTPAASKPNWVFIETAQPYLTEEGATSITGDQIEGAVWNSIIHGAAGIAYFQHNNNGTCGNYSLVECSQALRTKVTSINASVASLAPVINTPTYAWSFGTGLDTALKARSGYAYVFAMTDGGSGERTFSLPGGVEGQTVEVVGENRTLGIADGTFTDTFASEDDHHIYRIPLAG